MSKRSSELLLTDILTSAQSIIDYTLNYNYDKFLKDRKTVDAVIRNFEIIGAAANRLSDDVKDALIEIDWIKIRGFRNGLIHDYFGIDYKIVWDTAHELLPGLIVAIKAKLNVTE